MDEYDDTTTADIPDLPEGWGAFLGSVAWINPYTEPPDGLPRHLAECVLKVPPGRGCPATPPDLHALLMEIGLGKGWCWSVAHIPRPIVHWSAARTFAYRKSRLALRMRTKFPMFAAKFIQEAMERKPEYYGLTAGVMP